MIDFIQDDDFLTKEEQYYFVKAMFGDETSNQIPSWRMTNILPILTNQHNNKIFPFKETPLAFMTPQVKPFFQVLGDLEFKDFGWMFDKFCVKNNIRYDKILRSRLVITGMNDDDSYHLPHVDTVINHKVFLYYLHDVDGDTVFFDKKLGDDLSTPKIIKSVSPKMGRAINFDGHQFHSSYTTTKTQFRCVFNICYTEKKD
jgi:hypothetical protein